MTALPTVQLFASIALPLVAGAAAASAVALPVLIHLLSRQRFQVVPWAAMRFLITAQKSHRRSIDRWILLLARIVAMLCILAGMCAVAPWAESLWQSITPGQAEAVSNAPRTHRIIVVDCSLSLSTRGGDKTRFEQLQTQLEKCIQSANPGDGFTLIQLASTSQAIIPGPASDKEKVLEEAKLLRPTHSNGDLVNAMSLVADALQRSPRAFPRKQVLLFTDLQRSAWSGLLPKEDGTAPDIWQRVLPKAEVAVVDVAQTDPDNLAVTDLSLSDALPLVEAPTAVTATVQNFGKTERKGIRLELHLGRPSAGGPETTLLPINNRIIESLPPGQRISVTFALEGATRFREPGLHLLQVKLSDSDDLTPDDSRILAFEVRESIPTVLVNGQPAADPLRQATGYLQEAFELGGKRIPGNPVRSKTLKLSEFSDPTLGDLSGVDCVFLCDVPSLTPAQISRLEAHLKRGGGLVIGLGPNAAANIELYNRTLFNDGKGLLPGKLVGLKSASPDELGYRLQAEDEAYRKRPLDAFRDDNARGGLTSVPFKRYIKMDAPSDGRARRILSFVKSEKPKPKDAKEAKDPEPKAEEERPDPAVVEWPRHRGRVVVYTSTFNSDWTDWPVLPSFLPFAYEIMQFAASNPDRHTLRVGDTLEEYFPLNTVGLNATVSGPEGINTTVTVQAGDEVGVVRFPDTTYAGVYRLSVGGRRDRVFAVNVPETGTGSESDLRRVDAAELKTIGAISVVTDSQQAEKSTEGDSLVTLTPRPHGPKLARWLLTIAFGLIMLEAWLAWRLGPSRASIGMSVGSTNQTESPSLLRPLFNVLGLLPIAMVGMLLLVLVHYEFTGQVLGFLPNSWRSGIEQLLGVPSAGVGEGSRWRIEGMPAYLKTLLLERRLLIGLCLLAGAGLFALYRLERRAAGRLSRLLVPFALRFAAVALLLFILLPQLRLAFDREGWPDIVILLDTSASMSTIDDFQDAEVKKKAQELARLENLTEVDRLRLAKLLVARPNNDLITQLIADRQIKVHLYSMADQAKLISEVAEASDIPAAKEGVAKLTPDGEASRLGDAIQAVLKNFRGGSLVAIIGYTDGIVTAGEELARAGREAARSNVPLYLVGIGDAREPPDLILSDLKAPDSILKNDTLIFEAQLTAKGAVPRGGLPVILSERQGDKLVELARITVTPDLSGKPVPVRLSTIPKEAGEKSYVIELPEQPGEAESGNNRLERVVLVTENKRLKVLYLEGYPRYEFRFVKAFLERETDAVLGNKSIDLSVFFPDASPGFAEQDKSALRELPTRTELFTYDVVFYGDVLPSQLPKANQFYQDLAEFVKVRGGGLLFISGQQATPHQLFGTPIGELLPLVPSEGVPADGLKPGPDTQPLVDEYRPKLTPFGQMHSLFRFVSDEGDNARIWNELKPMFWNAAGYKRKLAAEVLAVHPERPAEGFPGELHPVIIQQFVGSGRVLFYGFDETWRWRFRTAEERFNQFWMQTAQVLSRNRISRPELKTDKQTAYRRDEPIKLTVRFPDDAPPPADDAKIKVSVDRKPLKGQPGGADSQTIQLAKVEGTRATFQTLLTRTPEGEYRFQLVEPAISGSKPRAEAKVIPPPGERERLEMNKAELIRAATDSRGKYYSLNEAENVVQDLPPGDRIPLNQPCPPLSIWNHGAMYLVVLALFGLEWIIRRRERLL
jgi:hypothetical protein